jgi:hypothetical protein
MVTVVLVSVSSVTVRLSMLSADATADETTKMQAARSGFKN